MVHTSTRIHMCCKSYKHDNICNASLSHGWPCIALVRPVLSYGCEVWAPLCAEGPLRELEKQHLTFLRRILGVPRTTSAKHLYAETGRLPHIIHWWQLSLGYMHHASSLPSNRITKLAYLADGAQGLGWRQAVLNGRPSMSVTLPPAGATFEPDASISALMAAAEQHIMTPDPASHLDLAFYSHKRSFGMEEYLHSLGNKKLRCTLARFRLGQHWLRVRSGRFHQH